VVRLEEGSWRLFGRIVFVVSTAGWVIGGVAFAREVIDNKSKLS